jgi:hypothetical protein
MTSSSLNEMSLAICILSYHMFIVLPSTVLLKVNLR